MSNLLQETLDILKRKNRTPEDVLWVGAANGAISISWKGFTKIANVDYDSGYGGQEIRPDLLVVGKNWWLERHEYDGSEWWEYKELPVQIVNPKRLYTVWESFLDEAGHEMEENSDPVKDMWEEYKEDLLPETKLIEHKDSE